MSLNIEYKAIGTAILNTCFLAPRLCKECTRCKSNSQTLMANGICGWHRSTLLIT